MSAIHEAFNPSRQDANVVLNNVACESAAQIGHAVKMVAGVAYRALADSIANSNIIGIIEAKSSPTICNIRVQGVTPEIFVGLNEAEEYYLSATTAGEMATTPPTNAGEIIIRVGQPFSSTRMLVLKGIRIQRA